VAGVRIRWRGVARAAAIVVVGLVALRLVPSLLHAPDPPPLGRDVGLPKAAAAKEPVRVVKPKRPKVRRRSVPDAPAAKAVMGTRTRHRHKRHRKPATPPPEPVESARPPAPEYVSPPVPEPTPTPVPEPSPAPRSVPGDGSQEFAPH
jgi:hypothetical protein